MVVSQEQAKMIAHTIVFDIHAYIDSNRIAFEQFLKEEERKEAKSNDYHRTTKTKETMDCLEEKI